MNGFIAERIQGFPRHVGGVGGSRHRAPIETHAGGGARLHRSPLYEQLVAHIPELFSSRPASKGSVVLGSSEARAAPMLLVVPVIKARW